MPDVIKTELPLPAELMVQFFNDKSQIFEIDYLKTKENLVPKSMLVYLANLKIDCDFDFIDAELMKEFMMLKETTNITNLQYMYANILYYGKYNEILYDDFLPPFSIEQFISDNNTIVRHHINVLNSLPLFVSACYKRQEQNDVTVTQNVVDHLKTDNRVHSEFGFAMLGLFQLSDFMMAFMEDTLPLEEQTYFVQYFDEFMFGGKNLFYYFSHPNNTYFGLATILTGVLIDDDDDAKERLLKFIQSMHSVIGHNNISMFNKMKDFIANIFKRNEA